MYGANLWFPCGHVTPHGVGQQRCCDQLLKAKVTAEIQRWLQLFGSWFTAGTRKCKLIKINKVSHTISWSLLSVIAKIKFKNRVLGPTLMPDQVQTWVSLSFSH